MRLKHFLAFLGLLCLLAAFYVLHFGSALSHRDQVWQDALRQKVAQAVDLENRLRRLQGALPKPGAQGEPPGQGGVAAALRNIETAVGPDGKPVVEAENFADKAVAPLIDTQEDTGSATSPLNRFPKRQQALPRWAADLPLYDPMPRCLSGPPPAHTTRLTRRFTIDVPGPELARLRQAICVVRLSRPEAFTEALTLFAFRYLPYVLLLDLYGNILASHTFDYLTTLVAPKWVNSTTISGILKRYGTVPAGWVARTVPFLWNVETGQTVEVPFHPRGFLHHDIDFSPVTQTFMALHRYVNQDRNSPGYNVLFDDIYEVDLSGRAVWHFNGTEHIPYVASQWIPDGKHPDSDCVDFRVRWCRDHMHGNTVFWDQEEDVIYYNAKHTDSFWKIRKADKQILWAVGRYGNMTLLDNTGKRVPKLFTKSHGLEKIGPDHFLLFDNVYETQGRMGSRWIEITVDPERRIAREGTFWVAPPPRYAHQMGDADRLPNGNTLLSITSTDQITEATPDGHIAWELTLPAPPPGRMGKWWIYQVERFMLVPLVRPVGAEPQTVSPTQPTLRLEAWNTVRVRYRAKGLLQVLHNASVLAVQPFTFAINWIVTPLSVPLPLERLKCGLQTLTVLCSNADDITGSWPVDIIRECS